jgi:ketosteroid isomerase-like protein
MPDSGKYIEIWRKQSDGTWKLVRDIFNSDLPLPTPTPVPAQRPK